MSRSLGTTGRLEAEQLLELIRVGKPVEGYVVEAEDLAKVIAKTGLAVTLRNAIVEGTLDLSKAVNLHEKGRIEGPIHFSNVEVRIPATQQTGPWAAALLASKVQFAEAVEFENVHFDGLVAVEDAVFSGVAVFEKCHFIGPALFARTEFQNTARFVGSAFAPSFSIPGIEYSADFTDAEFRAEALFGGAAFSDPPRIDPGMEHGAARFLNVVFHDVAHFPEAQFGSSVRFSGASFHGDAILYARFMGHADFSSTQFFKIAAFKNRHDPGGAVFEGTANFYNARFEGPAYFWNAKFAEPAHFGSVIAAGMDFDLAKFVQGADFDSAQIENLGFKGTHIAGPLSFSGSNLRGSFEVMDTYFSAVDFSGARLPANLKFDHSTFKEPSNFRDTKFAGTASFKYVVFQRESDFEGAEASVIFFDGARFADYVNLRRLKAGKLSIDNSLSPRVISARFDLRSAQLNSVVVTDTVFEKDVDFSDAVFGLATAAFQSEAQATKVKSKQPPVLPGLFLQFVTFEGRAIFARTQFSRRLILDRVNFLSSADFSDADFFALESDKAASFTFSYVNFVKLRLHWHQLPRPDTWLSSLTTDQHHLNIINTSTQEVQPEPLSEVLQRFERQFRETKQLEDANAAHYYVKLAELYEARVNGALFDRLIKEIEWSLWGIVCGYGTKLSRALTSAALLVVIFALLYAKGFKVQRIPTGTIKPDFSFKLRLLDLPYQYVAAGSESSPPTGNSPSRLRDAFLLSAVVLLKVGPRDTTVTGSKGLVTAKSLVVVEWLLGYYVLAAIVVTLTNTQPLLNRLLSGVF